MSVVHHIDTISVLMWRALGRGLVTALAEHPQSGESLQTNSMPDLIELIVVMKA